jgi:hypothetical protein
LPNGLPVLLYSAKEWRSWPQQPSRSLGAKSKACPEPVEGDPLFVFPVHGWETTNPNQSPFILSERSESKDRFLAHCGLGKLCLSRFCIRARLQPCRKTVDTKKGALQPAEKPNWAVCRGFIPGIKPMESTGASAPDGCFSPISPEIPSFSAAPLAPEGAGACFQPPMLKSCFVSGHGFSRAANAIERTGLQPLREGHPGGRRGFQPPHRAGGINAGFSPGGTFIGSFCLKPAIFRSLFSRAANAIERTGLY